MYLSIAASTQPSRSTPCQDSPHGDSISIQASADHYRGISLPLFIRCTSFAVLFLANHRRPLSPSRWAGVMSHKVWRTAGAA